MIKTPRDRALSWSNTKYVISISGEVESGPDMILDNASERVLNLWKRVFYAPDYDPYNAEWLSIAEDFEKDGWK